ncbi:uncharacterized protein [Misgurnus anguillicaudatus]|uniref:uncharacterized protein n=1 Tax=Misgurnus anguillicaudatus TaxID=75329 RepID=UPI003CCF0A64
MTKRKGKSNNKLDDSLVLLEPSVAQPRALKEYAVPAALFFIFVVGGSTAVWFCSQQQQTIDSLTESLNAMQLRITKFQQQLGIGNAQGTSMGVFEERLQALEEAYTRAQEKADVGLATSEKIHSTDLNSQVWALQSEMNAKLSELQQTTVSTATLNAVLKNKTEELEKLKQRIKSVLSANSEVAVSISGLTDTVLITTSRLDEQISTVESLTSRLELQKTELASLKESFAANQKALERNRQEVIDIKDLLEMEQIRRTQALEDQLMSVRRSLEDHQKSTHSLHSHLAAQLEIVQSQMSSQSQQSSPAEEVIQIKEQHAATEEELVPVKDEEINEVENQTVTEEEANAGDVHGVEEEAVEEHVITEKEKPAEDVLEEGGKEQAEEDEMAEEQDKEAVTDENEQADEVQVKEDVTEVTGHEEIPEELEVRDDVVEDQMVSEEEEPAKELEVKEDAEDQVGSEEEEAAEELGVKEDAEDQVGSEEEEPAEDLQVQGKENVKDHSVIEEDVIPEEDQVKDGDVAKKQDEALDGEEAGEEQTEEAYAKEDLTTTEKSESNAVNAAVPSEDQLVGDNSQEESQQDSFEEPVEEIGDQIDLEKLEHVYDSEEEDEEPAEELVEELDE